MLANDFWRIQFFLAVHPALFFPAAGCLPFFVLPLFRPRSRFSLSLSLFRPQLSTLSSLSLVVPPLEARVRQSTSRI